MADSTENNIDMNDIYYLDVYNQIETLLDFCKQRKNAVLIEKKIFLIQNSTSSELKEFFRSISKKTQFKMLNLDFMDESSYNEGLNSDLINNDIIIEKMTDFLEQSIDNLDKESENSENKDTSDKTLSQEISKNDKKELLDSLAKREDSTLATDEKELDKSKIIENKDFKTVITTDTLSKKKTQKEIKQTKIDSKPDSEFELKIIIFENVQFIVESQIKLMKKLIRKFAEISTKKTGENSNQIPILFIVFNENAIIPREIVIFSDLILTIPYPTRIQRLEFFESAFKKIKIHTVEISELAELTDGWNVLDMKRLLKTAYFMWNMLNFNEIEKESKESEDALDENHIGKINNSRLEEKNANMNIDSENERGSIDPDINDVKNDKNEKNLNEKNNEIDQIKIEQEKKISEVQIKKKLGFDYKIPFTIDIFRDLIKNKQVVPLKKYLPEYVFNNLNQIQLAYNISKNNYSGFLNSLNESQDFSKDKKLSSSRIENAIPEFNHDLNKTQDLTLLRGVNINELNSFTSNQLYQYAATNKYEELTLILEKLSQGKKLDDLDRKVLADYAFILRDEPQRALMLLTNAKNRINRIKKISK